MQRHAWILFVVIGGLGLFMSVAMLFNPTMGFDTLAGVAPAAPSKALLEDPFMAFVFRWMATALVGANALTVFIASTAFRRGERWAGFALMYWPLMFLSHLLMYRWGPMSIVQLVWLSLTVPALAMHLRRSAPREAQLAAA